MNYDRLDCITGKCHEAITSALIQETIPVDTQEVRRAIKPNVIRNIIIRSYYNISRANGVKSEALLAEIAERYFISYEESYSITHRRR